MSCDNSSNNCPESLTPPNSKPANSETSEADKGKNSVLCVPKISNNPIASGNNSLIRSLYKNALPAPPVRAGFKLSTGKRFDPSNSVNSAPSATGNNLVKSNIPRVLFLKFSSAC